MPNMDKELLKALDDVHLAITNAQEKCQEALLEIEKLKLENLSGEYMETFNSMIEKIYKGGG